jgi:hypothetical protein
LFPNDLEKLLIENLDTGDQIPVLFNPTQYSIDDGNAWKEQERTGKKPELQFTAQKLRAISMELFVDSYETKTDVRQYTDQIAALLIVSFDTSNGGRPPLLQLNWGGFNTTSGFPAKCVLESLKLQFVLFNREGVPVRAKLNTSFKEYVDLDEEEKANPSQNSFPDQIHTVNPGDALSNLAWSFWKKPELWRLIARANDIDNPRLLTPGRRLNIPYLP